MSALSQWLHQLGFLILFAGMAEIVLPNTSVRNTTRLFIGLIIILSIVDPLVGLIVDPQWIDGLFADAFRLEADPFIKTGTDMAVRISSQAEEIWLDQAAQQLAVLVTLIDGIADARVTVDVDSYNELWNVDVTVFGSEAMAGDEQALAEKQYEVIHLIHKAVRPHGVGEVRFAWQHLPVVQQTGN